MEDFRSFIPKIVNVLETPIFTVSYPDFRHVVANSAYAGEFVSPILGREVSEGEILGKPFGELFSESAWGMSLGDALEKAGGGNKTVKRDNFLLTGPHGETRVFKIVLVPLPDEKNIVRHIFGWIGDVTDRSRLAGQESLLSGLRESIGRKESLLSVLNVLPMGLMVYSGDGVVRYVNESFFWISGYDGRDLEGLHREEAERLLFRPAAGNSAGGRTVETGCHLLTRYKEMKPVEIFHIPLVKLGMVDGTVTLVREKNVELDLDRANMVLRAVLDSVSSIVVISDGEGKIRFCSKSCLELADLDGSEIIGQPIDRVREMLKVQVRELSCQTVRGKKYSNKVQVTITTRTGRSKTILVNSTPLLGRDGEIIGQVSVGSDMTSFIEKQEKLIENERLAVIGQLTSSIAHEIKNPLTVISGFAEVTKSKILKMEGNESLKESMLYYQQEIIDNSRNMNRLIIDLLQLARPRKAEKVRTNLAGTLDKICNTIAPYALQRNVTLIKNLMAADLEIAIDPVQIGQVLLNLCNNAIQAMEGGGTLNISTELLDDQMAIQVSDTGCGIRKDDIAKLGTPFYTTKAEGTGLGLSVTYSIIRDYGGKVEVESEVGRGSVFKVYLPLDRH